MIRKFFRSFKHATRGINDALLKGGNIFVHIVVAIATILLGTLLHISRVEWCIVLICIGIVISAEIINTAIEHLVDMYSLKRTEHARIIKDMSAGAVLVVSIAAFIIAMIIFVPKVLNLFM